jgi:membrane-bound serine protease (ClpP class)
MFKVIILQLLGFLAIIAEFLIPSMGIIVLVSISIFGYSFLILYQLGNHSWMYMAVIDLILIPLVIYFSVKFLGSTRLPLQNKIQSNIMSKDKENDLVGAVGIVLNDLRPAGRVSIDDVSFDAITDDGYIEKGVEIKVVSIDINSVKVTKNV